MMMQTVTQTVSTAHARLTNCSWLVALRLHWLAIGARMAANMRKSVDEVKKMMNRYVYSGVPEPWIPLHEAAERPKLLYARTQLHLDLTDVATTTAEIVAKRPLATGAGVWCVLSFFPCVMSL